MLGNFLTAFLNNNFFNPIWDEGTDHELPNGNICGLIEMIFGTALGENYHKEDVQAVISTADGNDMVDLANAIGVFASSSALTTLSGGGSFELSSLADASFQDLFGAIGQSKILRAIFTPLINETIFGNVDILGEGGPIKMEFNEATDWANEGKVIDAIIGFAAKHGDFANIDFLNSEPSAIAEILTALSGSTLFVNDPAAPDYEEIKNNYPFSNFIADKMVDSFVSLGEAAFFFSNRYANDDPNKIVDPGAHTFSESDFSQFKAGVQAIAKEEWPAEAASIARILGMVSDFSSLNSGDLTSFSSKTLRELLYAAQSSKVFGKFLTYHLHEKLVDMLKSAQPAFGSANVGYLMSDSSNVDYENAKLIELLEFVLNPTGKDGSGNKTYSLLDGDGSFHAESFKIFGEGAMSGKTITDLLTTFSSSHIYNGKPESGLSAFETEIATMLGLSSIYGENTPENQALINGYIDAITPDGVGSTDEQRFAIWDGEIRIIGQMVDEFSNLGLSFEGSGMDFTSLLDDSATRDENVEKIEKLLIDFNESGALYHALPIQIENAMKNANLSMNGVELDLSNANFGYRNGQRYERAEIRNIVKIFYYYSLLDYDIDIADIATDPAKAAIIRKLLACMKYDKILSTPKSEFEPSIVDAISALFANPGAEPIAPIEPVNPLDPEDPSSVAEWSEYASAVEAYGTAYATWFAKKQLSDFWNSLQKPAHFGWFS